jgi:predicted RNase H-like HicB family nuclease
MANKTAHEILLLPYERVLIPEEEGGYSAYIAEFDGCTAEGETADEAMRNLNASAIGWIEAEQEAKRDIPPPWNLQEYSGKILLRLPKSLHQQLARQAEKEGVSLNQYAVHKLSSNVQADLLLATIDGMVQKGWTVQVKKYKWKAATGGATVKIPGPFTSEQQSTGGIRVMSHG